MRLVTTIACLILAWGEGPATAGAPKGKIVIDASKDGGVWWFPQVEGRFDPARQHQGKRLADLLRSNGWDVEEVARGEDITGRLAGAKIVIRANFSGSYRASEVDAYRDFAANGGGVVLLKGFVRPGEEDNDAVARGFGVRFSETVRGARIARWGPNPLTQGIANMPYGVGSIVTELPSAATALANLDSGKTAVGIAPFGKGKVLFAGTVLGLLEAPVPFSTRVLEELVSTEPISRLARIPTGPAAPTPSAADETRTRLIGQKAAPLAVEAWVNGAPLNDDDLKGKVVLLDFWAVWCGPCIATFPHLREWNEKYAEKGLVMIGLTDYYNYDWDEQAGKASRSEDRVAPEQERAMLEKFAAQHKLTHRFGIQKEHSLSRSYGVTGIPQAVVIDREGVVRLIKVGSGEANARAIGELLEKLLAPGGSVAEAAKSNPANTGHGT